MAKKIIRLGTEASISTASSVAVLIGALIANPLYAQEDAPVTQEEATLPAEEAAITEDATIAEEEEVSEEELSEEEAALTEEETLPEEDGLVNSEAVQEESLEEVTVYGIRQSLKTAQDLKRDAATVVDAITASDITSLPDKSVVDALTRVPGVTVEVFEATNDPEHFGAEGSSALVRGLDRTLTQFNGRTSFSATQWGALNLSHIPSELVGAIEVQKNQTASMIEGGIAGTLNLVTRKPFDSPGMQLGGSIKVDYSNEAEEWSPSISGLFSNRWESDLGEVGFLVSVALSETYAASEAVGTHNYYERSDRTTAAEPQGDSTEGIGPPLEGDPEGVYWQPPSIQARKKFDERDRIGFVSSLQWQNPDETLMATLEFIRSDGTAVWTERLLQNKDQLGNQFGNADVAQVLEIPGLSGFEESFDPNTGLFTHGVLSQAGADDYAYAPETRYHNEKTYVNDLSLDVEWRATENLTINSDLQYVDSGQVMFDHTIHSFFRSDVWMDFRDNSVPQIGFLGANFRQLTPEEAAAAEGTLFLDAEGNYWGGDTSSITNPENIHTRSAMDHNTDSSGDALAFAVDADYQFDEGIITNVKAGFRHSTRSQLHKSTEYDWGVISPEWSEEDRRSVADYPEFQEVVDFGGDFHDGDAFVDGSVTAFYFPRIDWVEDLNAFEDYYKSLTPIEYDPNDPESDATWEYTAEEGAGDPFITLENQEVPGKPPGSPFAPYYIFDVEEKNTAAYVQVDFDFLDAGAPIRGNVGLRFVNIDVTTEGSREFEIPGASWISPERYYAGTEFVNMPDELVQFIEARRAEYEAEGEVQVTTGLDELQYLNGYNERYAVKPEKYSTVLPSFNLAWNFTESLLFRTAFSKAIYLPHLSLKRASQTMNATVRTTVLDDADVPTGWTGNENPLDQVIFENYSGSSISGSNPYLQPEESINIDVGLEWYFSDVGSLTAVAFTKIMDNLIRKGTVLLDIENDSTGVTEEVLQQDTYYNVGEATIEGFEISYQQTYDMLPGIWSGLGVQANYTKLFTDEDVTANIDTSVYGTFVDLPLEGLSPENYNFIVFYENEFFNTRLAYNFRSEYMLNGRDVIGKRPVYNADRGVLDYSITYNLTDEIKLGFDINNITNEQTRTLYQYDNAGHLSPRNYFINDQRFTFRISGSF